MKLADWEVEHWVRVYSSAIGGMFASPHASSFCGLNRSQSAAAEAEADRAIELLRERFTITPAEVIVETWSGDA